MLKNVLWREAPSKVVPENSGGVCQYMAECPKGRIVHVWVLTINWVGQVLWSIYKMSNYTSKGSLFTKIPSQESGVMGMREEESRGVYMNSKHRVRGNQAAWNFYYKGKQGQGWYKVSIVWFWTQGTSSEPPTGSWFSPRKVQFDEVQWCKGSGFRDWQILRTRWELVQTVTKLWTSSTYVAKVNLGLCEFYFEMYSCHIFVALATKFSSQMQKLRWANVSSYQWAPTWLGVWTGSAHIISDPRIHVLTTVNGE